MEKIHLDLQVTSGIADAYRRSAEEISHLSGANLGNLVFRHALKFLIADFSDYRPVNYPQAKQIAGERSVKSVLVSCANWLGTREQDEKSNKVRADIIESINAPVISLGLGVQAPHGTEEVKLGPESERLARVLASKAELLSVRDQLTGKTLRRLGIDNISVTGCPSNFINLRTDLGASIVDKANALSRRGVKGGEIRTCISEFSGGHGQSGAILQSILRTMQECPAFYVAQSPVLLPFLVGECSDIPPEYISNSKLPKRELSRLLKEKAFYFTSVDGWLDFSRTCDFSFGMRIHGSIVPLQAGVPSLLIGHDSRTSGLGTEMGVPIMTPETFLKFEIYDLCSMSNYVAKEMEEYDVKRKNLAGRVVKFLVDNGLEPTANLYSLSNG